MVVLIGARITIRKYDQKQVPVQSKPEYHLISLASRDISSVYPRIPVEHNLADPTKNRNKIMENYRFFND